MSNRNRPSEWAIAIAVLARRRLSTDGQGPQESDRKSAVDDHGEVPGGRWIGSWGEELNRTRSRTPNARCSLEKAERRAKESRGGS